MAWFKENAELYNYGLLLVSAALYGATFMLISVAVETVPPVSVVVGRQALAALIFIGIALSLKQSLPRLSKEHSKIWILIFCAALFGNSLPFFLTTWGQEKVDAGLAAIIISTMPLITVVLAHYFSDDERLNLQKMIGLAFGFVGIIILFGPQKLTSLGEDSVRQYAILGSAVSFAVNMIVMKHLTGLPRYSLLAAILGMSFLLVLPFSLIERPWLLEPSYNSLLAIAGIGIMTSAIGNLLSFKLLERRGAIFNSQTNYLIPIAAIFWAWLVLDEVPSAVVYFALALILFGVAIIQGSPKFPILNLKAR